MAPSLHKFAFLLSSAPSAQLRQLIAAAGNKVTRFSRHNQRNVTQLLRRQAAQKQHVLLQSFRQ